MEGTVETTTKNGDLIQGGKKTKILIVMFFITIAADLITVISGIAQYNLLNSALAGAEITQSAAEANDTFYGIAGFLQVTAFILTAVFFLMWLYRAHKNLVPLGSSNLQYSPKWAVGGFFVPFLNLVRPYQVAKEIFQNSIPPEDSFIFSNSDYKAPSENIIKNWWGSFIIMSFAGNFAGRYYMRAESIQEILSATNVNMVADCLSVVAAILAIKMVKSIDSLQLNRHQSISIQSS
jgi:hypothetical protein